MIDTSLLLFIPLCPHKFILILTKYLLIFQILLGLREKNINRLLNNVSLLQLWAYISTWTDKTLRHPSPIREFTTAETYYGDTLNVHV